MRSVVSLLARRVAKRRDMFLAGARLARRCPALGAYAGAARRRQRVLALSFPADLSSVRMSVSPRLGVEKARAQILTIFSS